MPRRGSEAYVIASPSDVEAMKLVLDKVNEWLRTAQDGKLTEAAALAAQMKYRVLRFNDPSLARVFIVLLEDSSVNRGWGTYLFYLMPNGQYRNLLIEVPHPLFDVNTPEVGILAYIKSEAMGFLIAGSHRYANRDNSSDVPWAPVSMFNTVHQQFTDLGSVAIQVHGFVQTQARNYPQIILSRGDGLTAGPIATFASLLRDRDFTVGTYDGFQYGDLSGNNQQSKYSRSVGAVFIHMEMERPIRDDKSKYSRVADAITGFARMEVITVRQFTNLETIVLVVLGVVLVGALPQVWIRGRRNPSSFERLTK